MSRGRLHAADHLAAFIADDAGHAVGLATYSVVGKDTELVSIDSLVEGRGVGTALLGAVASAACAAGSRRLWLVTSNDNLDALRFYQRRGLRLVAVHPGAVDAARTLKPQIPVLGPMASRCTTRSSWRRSRLPCSGPSAVAERPRGTRCKAQ
ncbi:MAG TPA: GNAT family N-acetyltransferase [Acidimicrobiales bacterium]|nr:GNAT family N-acetyltransferase [Acidimicrobiales bacterium]